MNKSECMAVFIALTLFASCNSVGNNKDNAAMDGSKRIGAAPAVTPDDATVGSAIMGGKL